MVTMSNTISKLLSRAAKPSDPVSKVVYRQFEKVHSRLQLLPSLCQALNVSHVWEVLHKWRGGLPVPSMQCF